LRKVKFENPTCHRIHARFPGVIVDIPAHATGDSAYIAELPELEVVGKWITDLMKRHRAIKASLVEDEVETTEPDDSIDVIDETDDSIDATEEIEDDTKDATEAEDLFEAFKADVVSVSEGGGGWWAVTVKDINDPIKVRGCEDENEAILEAYQKHMEG